MAPRFPGDIDEAWLVELADWHGQTAQHVAATIGVREEQGVPLAQTLAEALRPRHMLLILDTCEHQVSDCATLVQLLLARCPWLRIIATSREPLRVRGETVWRVPPLRAPHGLADAELAAHEAVRLFATRAAGARPGFTLTEDNTASVARPARHAGRHTARHRAVRRPGRFRSSRSPIGCGTGSSCSIPVTGPRHCGSRRFVPPWTGATSCSTGPSRSCCDGWPSSPAGTSTWPSRSAPTTLSPADTVLGLLISLIDKSLVVLDGEAALAKRQVPAA